MPCPRAVAVLIATVGLQVRSSDSLIRTTHMGNPGGAGRRSIEGESVPPRHTVQAPQMPPWPEGVRSALAAYFCAECWQLVEGRASGLDPAFQAQRAFGRVEDD